MLELAQDLPSLLLWPPLTTSPEVGREVCARFALQTLGMRWGENDPMPGCRLVYRFTSEPVTRCLIAVVEALEQAMGWEW
ncbi:hypothetical protein [Thiorhodococcus minor]|uniref:Uncharacterized protein n=1 Tax=Thiorhodococcus minor TaxID=57489 RepID=A0A6M0JXS6_9GAMM|nr:hypothetical protein [Thiorhodococcus minor]NEV61147.1 hypothetical protein [Thiorhodococcus minor]